MSTEIKEHTELQNPFSSVHDLEAVLKEKISEYMVIKRKIYTLRQKQRIELGATLNENDEDTVAKELLNKDVKEDEVKKEENSKKRQIDEDNEGESEKKRVKKEDDEERLNRTKRVRGPQKLFSNLLFGTLRNFKADMSNESNKEKEQIRRDLEKKVEEKAALDSERLKEERLQAIQKELDDYSKRSEELEEFINNKEEEVRNLRVEVHQSVLNRFIKTSTNPPIYFMPKKRDAFVEGILKKSLEKQAQEMEEHQSIKKEEVEKEEVMETNDDLQ